MATSGFVYPGATGTHFSVLVTRTKIEQHWYLRVVVIVFLNHSERVQQPDSRMGLRILNIYLSKRGGIWKMPRADNILISKGRKKAPKMNFLLGAVKTGCSQHKLSGHQNNSL